MIIITEIPEKAEIYADPFTADGLFVNPKELQKPEKRIVAIFVVASVRTKFVAPLKTP